MNSILKSLFTAVAFLLVLSVQAQTADRSHDPTLNKGEGLEMSRSDLAKMRNQKQDKNSRQVDIYMFGASFSLIDSVLYVSYTQKMDSVTVNNRWFLKERAGFEKQFCDYLGGTDASQLATIYFSDNVKKIEKRREKLIKRNARKNRFQLKQVPEFRFKNSSEEYF